MFSRLLILFIVVPMIELALLIEVGKQIGFWPTVGIICLTGLLGSALAKQQGMAVWTQFNSRMQKGQLPGTELVDGLIILVAGALLLTPGVLTDVVGFLGLLPPSRALIRKFAQKRITVAQANGNIKFNASSFNAGGFNTGAFSTGTFNTDGSFVQQNAPTPPVDSEPQWQGTPKERPEDD
ncbi:MAG: FxsA family protein [Rhodothermales bacterium]